MSSGSQVQESHLTHLHSCCAARSKQGCIAPAVCLAGLLQALTVRDEAKQQLAEVDPVPLLAVLLAGSNRQLEQQATAILFNLSGCREMVPCMKRAEVPKPLIRAIPTQWRTHFPEPTEVAASVLEKTSAEEESHDPADASSPA